MVIEDYLCFYGAHEADEKGRLRYRAEVDVMLYAAPSQFDAVAVLPGVSS